MAQLGAILAELQTVPAKRLNKLIHPLSEVFMQLASGFPQIEHKALHKLIADTLANWFNQTQDLALKAHIVDVFVTLGRRTGAVQLIEFPFKLIETNWRDYAVLPLAPSQVDNMVWLYNYCEKTEGGISERDNIVQQAITQRLEAQFSESPTATLQVLNQLSVNKDLAQAYISPTQIAIKTKYPTKYEKTLTLINQKPQTQKEILLSPSLLLTVWYGCGKPVREKLCELSVSHGIIKQAEIEVEVVSGPQYLFKHVKHMIIGSMTAPNGEIINYPPGRTIEELATFVLTIRREARKAVISAATEPLGESDIKTGLAAQIDFVFIGEYVQGIQFGVADVVINAAKELALNILGRMEKEKTLKDGRADSSTSTVAVSSENTPSMATLITQVGNSPIYTSADADKKEPVLAWYSIIEEDDEFILTITPRLIPTNVINLTNINDSLKSFVKNGDYVQDSLKERKDGIVLGLRSYTKEALNDLIGRCKSAGDTASAAASSISSTSSSSSSYSGK